jgi:hypothetical protein
MRDLRICPILIGAALAAVAVAAESTVSAQQMTPSAPQMPAASAAAAQPPASDRGLSITPFAVMGDDLAAGAGVSLVFPLTGRFGLEAEAMADRDAMRTGVSLLMNVARIGRFSTYVAGGAGVQRDESRDLVFGVPFPVYAKKTELAIGIGGGASVPISSRWSYRADFRWYNPKAEWPESWRISNGLTLHLAPR